MNLENSNFYVFVYHLVYQCHNWLIFLITKKKKVTLQSFFFRKQKINNYKGIEVRFASTKLQSQLGKSLPQQ